MMFPFTFLSEFLGFICKKMSAKIKAEILLKLQLVDQLVNQSLHLKSIN